MFEKIHGLIHKKKTAFISLILSYAVIMIAFVFSLCVSYAGSVALLRGEIRDKNTYLLDHMQSEMDTAINNIGVLSTEIILDDRVMEFIDYDSELSPVMRYNASNISDMLKIYRNLYGNTADIFIYSAKNDYILSSKVCNDSRAYHDMYFPDSPYEEWLDMISADKISYSSLPMRVSGASKSIVLLSKPLLTKSLINTASYICIAIDSDIFGDSFDKYMNGGGYSLFVMDSANNVIYENNSGGSYVPLYSDLTDKSGIYNNGDTMCIYSTSDSLGWKYVSVVSSSLIFKKLHSLLALNIAVLTITIAVFIVMYAYMYKRNYIPMVNIFNMLSHNMPIAENEYDYMEKSITDTVSMNLSMQDRIDRQNLSMRGDMLKSLLRDTDDYSAAELANLGIVFSGDGFVVCLYYIDDCDELFFERDGSAETNMRYSQVIIENIVTELMNRHAVGYMVKIDGVLAGIYNSGFEDAEREIKEINDSARQLIKADFNLFMSAAQSSAYRDIGGLKYAYKSALDVLEYKIVMSDTNNLTAEAIKSGAKHEYSYSLGTEQRLMNAVRLGDYALTSEMIDEIFKESFENNNPSLPVVQCLMMNIISTILKVTDDMRSIRKEKFINTYLDTDKLFKCKTINSLKDELKSLLKTLCGIIASDESGSSKSIKEKITDFVDNHYDDPSLNVSMIADSMNMSVSYISTVFKERCGVGLLDYINGVRVEKSLTLLKNPSLTVNTVANMVGYQVPRTYLNVFKKKTGMTPSQYRKLEKISD